MSDFVLDTSFAMTWIIEEERTLETMKYLEDLGHDECRAVVPAVWPDEMANVFLTLERTKKASREDLSIWASTLESLPIDIELPSLGDSLGEIRRLARMHSLTSYDASYLHLAIREKLELATRDKQLMAAARKSGVKLVT